MSALGQFHYEVVDKEPEWKDPHGFETMALCFVQCPPENPEASPDCSCELSRKGKKIVMVEGEKPLSAYVAREC